MKLGLITDVHNDIENLIAVLNALQRQGIEKLITLGDTCDAFAPPEGSDDVAQLLLQENAIGVWGNHDCVFRNDAPEFVRGSFGTPTFEFMASMLPRLEIDECHFSHLESSVDPSKPEELWKTAESESDLMNCASDAFVASPHRLQFTGHYHRWFAATPDGPINWNGSSPLDISDGRFFVVVSPVISGCGALLDTELNLLVPIRTS